MIAVSGIQQVLYGQDFCVAESDIIFSKLMFVLSKEHIKSLLELQIISFLGFAQKWSHKKGPKY